MKKVFQNLAVLVPTLGAIGGIAGWLVGLLSSKENWAMNFALGVFLGGFASYLFVFLLANTDRTDKHRLAALSLAAGFCGSPVLDMIRQFIDQKREKGSANEVAALIQEAEKLAEKAETATDPKEKTALAEQIDTKVSEATNHLPKIDSLNLRTALAPDVKSLLERLGKVDETKKLEHETKSFLWALDPSEKPRSIVLDPKTISSWKGKQWDDFVTDIKRPGEYANDEYLIEVPLLFPGFKPEKSKDG